DIFDSLLNRIYDFASTNTKLNSMKAFCQLLRRIARIQPAKALAKFIPHCVRQIETELEHGAASIPTTSTLDIAALQEAGKSKIKSERSYSLTGSIVKTILYSLTAVYPSNRQSLNDDEWKKAATERSSHRKWGKFYEGHEVNVDWHVPTDEEVNFALEILQEITNPAMLLVQQYINVVTSSWRGLDTLISLQGGDSLSEAILKEYDVPELQQHPFRPLASLCLTDPKDPRYGAVLGYREQLGKVLHAAAGSLRAEKTEDHTDAVSALITAVDTYLFHHGIKDETARRKRSGFDSGRRAWVFSRRQYDMPRNYWTKFAECDHHYRLQHLARCRPYNEIDKLLVLEILEFCRSPYVKIRRLVVSPSLNRDAKSCCRNAQNLAQAIAGVSDMHSEYVVTRMMEFLQSDSRAEKGDKSLDFADRIKGSLHTIRLGNLPSLAVISIQATQSLTPSYRIRFKLLLPQQEVPIILPDDTDVTDAINDLTRVYPTRDMKLEASAREKLAVRFVQLNEAIQSSRKDIALYIERFSQRILQSLLNVALTMVQRLYFDGTHTFCYGWVVWGTVFGHVPQTGKSPFQWHESSQPMLNEVREVLRTEGYFTKLVEYYAEEPNVDPTNLDTRDDAKATPILGQLLSCSRSKILPPTCREDDTDHETDLDIQAQRYIALIMGIVIQYDWQPSYQSMGALMEACSSQEDVFKTRAAPYRQQFLDVTTKLAQWRKSRLPPPHSLQSDFDRGASTIMQMMMGAISSTSAYIYLPYLQHMLPELLQTVEITDNPMLTALGTGITRMILSVSLPTIYIRPLFKSLVDMFQTSLSWRVRQRSSSMVSAIFLRYLERWSDTDDIPKILEVMLASLEDENVEVRSSASMNLALVIRSSMQNKISSLQLVLPSRSSPDYEKTIRQRHGAVLGLIALARSYPFTVPEWMPPLIEILSKYATEPTPISNSIRSFGQEFQQNHQDNWHADSKLFNEDQTLALSTIVSGTSYCALSDKTLGAQTLPALARSHTTTNNGHQHAPNLSSLQLLEQQSRALQAAILAFDQPPAPSLREVLGAYRIKGDGDREMLLTILNAKAAEDQDCVYGYLTSNNSPSVACKLGHRFLLGDESATAHHQQFAVNGCPVTSLDFFNGRHASRTPLMSISSLTSPTLPHKSHVSSRRRTDMEVDGEEERQEVSRAREDGNSRNDSRMMTSNVRAERGAHSRSGSGSPSMQSRTSHGSTSGSGEGRSSLERLSSERSTC
ncbi:12397_t:CDS:10, partial [Acaulospora colombiana]